MSRPHRPPVPVIILLVLALAGGGGYYWWRSNGSTATTDTALSGSVDADEYTVASVLSGRVVSCLATEGARVEKGALLYRLDDAVLRQQVAQAEAGARAAKAAWKQAKDDDDGSAAIAAAKARWDQAEAAVRMAKLQLGYARVTAPASGIISAVVVRAGENAGPGKSLATIVDVASLHVSVYVPETDIGKVALGSSASISTDSVSNPFSGKVTFIAEQAEFTPNNIETKEQRVKLVYEVRIAVDAPLGDLKPGMPVDVALEGLE